MKNLVYYKVFIICVFVTCSIFSLTAQPNKRLTIGDKVPDIVLKKMLNYSKGSAKLSEFKEKAILIDFWFKECGSCISSLPHLDSIQKEFQNDLQVLLVTWQSQQDIEKFWKTHHKVKHLKFVQVVEDTLLRQLFPARSFPHQVWINKDGYISAITDGSRTTYDNISKLVAGMSLNLKIKEDELDANVSFSVEPMIQYYYERNKPNLLFYSYFSKYRSEFSGGTSGKVDKINRLARITFRNTDFLSLYHSAYSNSTQAPLHRSTRIIRRDSNPIATEADYKEMSNIFCYDLIYSDTTTHTFGKYMVEDLNRFFNVRSYEEEIEMDCYILRPIGTSEDYKQPIDIADGYIINENLKKGELLVVNKMFLPTLEKLFMNYVDKPFLWELGMEMRKLSNLRTRENLISFKLTWDLNDLTTVNNQLKEYGLEIVVEKRPRKVIILNDR